MAGFIDRDGAHDVAVQLTECLKALPTDACALRATVRKIRNEYGTAAKMHDRALSDHGDECRPEIRALGSIERGELVQFSKVIEVKRTSETGLCYDENGYDRWINFTGKSAPLLVIGDPSKVEELPQ